MKPNFAAEVPYYLRDADYILHRYGRWCMDRIRVHKCGSAEKAYRSAQDEDDRQAREILMRDVDALAVQHRLASLPQRERIVLTILYIPRKQPIERLLRRAGISGKQCQELHLSGLRAFSYNFNGD